MSTIEQRVEHLETTITSLRTIPEAIKGLATPTDRLEARSDTILQTLQVHSKTLEVLADDVAVVKGDVAWIRKKLS